MSTTESTGELFPEIERPAGVVTVNERCMLRTREGFRLVIVNGMVVSPYSIDDRMAEAFAMVNLVEQGWANQNDVARAFGCSSRTVRRHQDRYASGGLAALGRHKAWGQTGEATCLSSPPYRTPTMRSAVP